MLLHAVHPATPPSFDVVYRSIDGVQGWMSEAQGRRLWDRARELRPGDQVVEIGSFQGRSTIVLASAAPAGITVVAIDPHGGNDRGPQEIDGYAQAAADDHRRFRANLAAAGVDARVRHLRKASGDALADVRGPVDLLYIDGAHRFGPARSDIVSWGARVAPGGTLLVHDAFSSVGVTLALATSTFWGPRFRYVGRSGSLVEYRREDLDVATRVTNVARQLAELPWFVRNLAVKVAIVARLRPVLRVLGSDGTWPY